jgi:hypothetical protein
MNEQDLKHLLTAADASLAERAMPRLDVTQLERLLARRRGRRGLATGVTMAALLAVVLLSAQPGRQEVKSNAMNTSPNAAAVAAANESRVEIAREKLHLIRHEIQKRKAFVVALRQAEELARLNEELAELERTAPSSVELSPLRGRQVRSEAAAVSLLYADLLATEYGENELAAVEYRRIVSRYPGTTWSTAAEQSLSSTPHNF